MYKSAGVQFKILAPVVGTVALSVVIGILVLDWNFRQLRDGVVPEERNLSRLHTAAVLLLNEYREYSLAPSHDALADINNLLGQLQTYQTFADEVAHEHDGVSREALTRAVADLRRGGAETVRVRDRMSDLLARLEQTETALVDMLRSAQREAAQTSASNLPTAETWRDTVNELSAMTGLLNATHRFLHALRDTTRGDTGTAAEQLSQRESEIRRQAAKFTATAAVNPQQQPFAEDLQSLVATLIDTAAELRVANARYREQIDSLERSESIITSMLNDIISVHGDLTDRTMTNALTGAALALTCMLCLVGLVAWLSLRQMRQSLRALSEASRRFGEGDLDVRTTPDSADEIGQLSIAFNQMADKLSVETRHRQQLQDDLIRQQKLAAVGQLTAIVSHELRNPLGTVSTSLFTISERTRNRGLGVEHALERAERNVRRCDSIIDELLDLTREHKLVLDRVTMDKWLNEVLDEHEIPEHIDLQRNIHSGVQLTVDRKRLRQAVVNIVDNAIQACVGISQVDATDGTTHHISITAECDDECFRITFDDTGPGIPEELLHKVSDPMFTTKAFGVGLGLPIAKKALEEHDGGLEINSNVGEGSQIAIWLPLTDTSQEQRV